MKPETLIATGGAGAALAALCCLTPILAIGLGAVGLSALVAKADYVLIPVLLAGLALAGFGLYRRRTAAAACCGADRSKASS